jgi:hypothetical protein
MLTQFWLEPGDERNEIYAVSTSQVSANPPVTAYAARHHDDTWSVMIVNKDTEVHSVAIDFGVVDGGYKGFVGPVEVTTFGITQYAWRGVSATEIPQPNTGPVSSRTQGQPSQTFTVLPQSITVFHARIFPYRITDP